MLVHGDSRTPKHYEPRNFMRHPPGWDERTTERLLEMHIRRIQKQMDGMEGRQVARLLVTMVADLASAAKGLASV